MARTVRRALVKAQARHHEWTGLWWPPPEYVATVEIADAVYRLEDVDWVTPERGVEDTLQRAGRGPGRPANALRSQGRFDIVVWSGNQPAGVIEVKTRTWSALKKDVERVCATIRNAQRIDWGIVAFISFINAFADGPQKMGRERVLDRTRNLAAESEQVVGDYGLRFTRHRGKTRLEDEGAWTAEVFEIYR